MMKTLKMFNPVAKGRLRENLGPSFADFKVGDVIEHRPGRTITEADNAWGSLIFNNPSPLHFDAHYCASTRWKKPLVSSAITLAIISGLSVRGTSANAVANLGWEKIELTGPVFVGDTIYAETKILKKRRSASNKKCGVVTVQTLGKKADGTVFMKFIRTFLMPLEESPSLSQSRQSKSRSRRRK